MPSPTRCWDWPPARPPWVCMPSWCECTRKRDSISGRSPRSTSTSTLVCRRRIHKATTTSCGRTSSKTSTSRSRTRTCPREVQRTTRRSASGTSSGLWIAGESICKSSASAATATSPSTSRPVRSARARESRLSPNRRSTTTPDSSIRWTRFRSTRSPWAWARFWKPEKSFYWPTAGRRPPRWPPQSKVR